MKKLLFLITLIAISILMCVVVNAKEYAPTNGIELNEAINEANTLNEDSTFTLNGDYSDYDVSAGYKITSQNVLTFNLEGDVTTKSRFLITGNLIVNLNSHTLTNATSRGGVEGSMFCIDKSGDVKGSLEVYNGNLTINDVCIAFQYGALKLHNVVINANEEAIWCSAGSCEGGGRSYKIDNCTFTGRDGTNIFCIDHDSYIKNLTILNGTLKFDAWHDHGNKLSGAVLENIDATKASTQFVTGANHYTFTNCKFGNISAQGDRNGACTLHLYGCTYSSISPTGDKGVFINVYTNATCDEAATLKVYTLTDKAGSYDTSYSEQNPKLGHGFDSNNITSVSYESYLQKGYYTSKCVRCDNGIATEDVPSAKELFTFVGYSTPEKSDSYGIVVSFTVNLDAVENYEGLTNKTVSYGFVAAAKNNLGDNTPLDINANPTVLENGSVVKAEISREYCAYDFVLIGMNEFQITTELVFATYVTTTKDGETEVVYLQETQKTENLNSISYNTVSKTE